MDDQESDHGSASDGGLPERVVTPNMLAGLNMERLRRAARLTQEELGEKLGGLTKKAVSAAEHSWDGEKVRHFDADFLARLAAIFGVPVSAFLLPPADDGEACQYLVDVGGRVMPMAEFFAAHVRDVPGEAAGSPAMRAHEEALTAAAARYRVPWAATASERLSERADDARLEAALRQAFGTSAALHRIEAALTSMRSDNTLLQDLLLAMMRQTPGGTARLEGIDGEHERDSWAELPPRARQEQLAMIALGRELFGDRGPATDEDFRHLIGTARERGLKGPPRVLKRLADGDLELIAPPDGPEGRS